MQPLPRNKRRRFPRELGARGRDLAELTVQPMILQQPPPAAPPTADDAPPTADDADGFSDDFEWDNDFAASPSHGENQTLLSKPSTNTGTAVWPPVQGDIPTIRR